MSKLTKQKTDELMTLPEVVDHILLSGKRAPYGGWITTALACVLPPLPTKA